MIDEQTIKQLKINHPLPGYIIEQEQLGLKRVGPHEWAGACPQCGGRDRYHVNQKFWFCRVCAPLDDKKSHDVIGYVMWRYNVEFVRACELLGAQTPPPPAKIIPTPTLRPATHELNKIYAQSHLLLLGKDELVSRYLASRGIGRDAISTYKLGARWRGARFGWVVTMPYFNSAGNCVAIRERLLIPAGNQKMIAAGGSVFGGQLFGLQAWCGRKWLVICEGELNAISVWIVARDVADAISIGSETISAATLNATSALAANYERVIIWADKATVARAVGERLPTAMLRMSPNGFDANDLLQRGSLGDLLDALGVR